MTKNEIIAYAELKGFRLWATVNQGKRLQFMDEHGINLWVNLYDNSFELGYIVPNSIFELHCPNCSPFGSTHFENMYERFRTMVLLKWGLLVYEENRLSDIRTANS